jgi:hypothetical protein
LLKMLSVINNRWGATTASTLNKHTCFYFMFIGEVMQWHLLKLLVVGFCQQNNPPTKAFNSVSLVTYA